GALPATAALMTSDGVPVTATWLIALTWNVTVCVAVWAEAVVPAAKATRAPIEPRENSDVGFMVWDLRDAFVCGFPPPGWRGTFDRSGVASLWTASRRWSLSNYRTL